MIGIIEAIDRYFRQQYDKKVGPPLPRPKPKPLIRKREEICHNGPNCDHAFCSEHNPDFEPDSPWTWPVTSDESRHD